MSVPDWVQDAVFYQIFPDRFANGDHSNDPVNKVPWHTIPTPYTFYGGDLQGIEQKLDYLVDLGINAIYLNPIFHSPSTHRYNTIDYFKIDPKLGSWEDWHSFVNQAHSRGVRLILDGVFNHCGRGFFAFNDVLENGEYSPYRQWFHIHRFPVDAYTPGDARDYEGWWKHKSLPKFNTGNPHVRRYLLEVARYWIDQGADGWRLDVPNEIDDDSFWAEFRYVVRSANPDAYLLGEIWDVVPRWVGENHFDGLMNYPLRTALLELFRGKIKALKFADQVEHLLTVYPKAHVYAQFNTLGTHDTERVLTMLGRNFDRVKAAFLFLFAYPGIPSIYYGDEIGMEGNKDPDCRRAFPWEPERWNQELLAWVKQLAHLRKQFPALRRGTMERILASDHNNCYAFARILEEERIVVVLNASDVPYTLSFPVSDLGWQDGRVVQNLITGSEQVVTGGSLEIHLPPSGGAYLK